jgi:hypothetical protein
MQPIKTEKNNNQSCLNQVQKVRELFMLDCTAYDKPIINMTTVMKAMRA